MFAMRAKSLTNLVEVAVLTALKNRKRDESVKASALRNNPYQGLQQVIRFDANGDTNRRVFFTEIRAGEYRRVD